MRDPWLPERGHSRHTIVTALKDGVDLGRVDGTFFTIRGQSRYYPFDIREAARWSSTKAALTELEEAGLIRIDSVNTDGRPVGPKKAEEKTTSVDQPISAESVMALTSANSRSLPTSYEQDDPDSSSSSSSGLVLGDGRSSDSSSSSSSGLVLGDGRSSNSSKSSNSSDGEEGADPELSDRLLAADQLLRRLGLAEPMCRRIVAAYPRWDRRTIEKLPFMPARLVGQVCQQLGRLAEKK